MRKEPTSNKSETDWKRLDAMTDEDTDIEDIDISDNLSFFTLDKICRTQVLKFKVGSMYAR